MGSDPGRSCRARSKCCGEGRRWQTCQPNADQISHRDQVACGAVVAHLRLGRIDEPVRGFHAAIVELRVEGTKDAIPVRLDGKRQALERLEPTAPRPAISAPELRR